MKVSVALHIAEPDPRGNQRVYEATYQNYNRCYADLEVNPSTGVGVAQFNISFPKSGEPFSALFFSIGQCIAPSDMGGDVIVYGPISGGLRGAIGDIPTIDAAVAVDAERLLAMGLVVKDGQLWRAKTDEELKQAHARAA